jgi:hypothetical protein
MLEIELHIPLSPVNFVDAYHNGSKRENEYGIIKSVSSLERQEHIGRHSESGRSVDIVVGAVVARSQIGIAA